MSVGGVHLSVASSQPGMLGVVLSTVLWAKSGGPPHQRSGRLVVLVTSVLPDSWQSTWSEGTEGLLGWQAAGALRLSLPGSSLPPRPLSSGPWGVPPPAPSSRLPPGCLWSSFPGTFSLLPKPRFPSSKIRKTLPISFGPQTGINKLSSPPDWADFRHSSAC